MGFTTTALGVVPTGELGRRLPAPEGATARNDGPFSPVMKLASSAAPVVASYLPTVPSPLFGTKRLLSESARPFGLVRPVMKSVLIGAPVVALYSPTLLPLLNATKRMLPENARPYTLFGLVIKLALIAAPV